MTNPNQALSEVNSLIQNEKYDEAIKHLRDALSKLPDPEVAAHLGEVLWVTGQQDEAMSVWQKVLENDPDNSTILETMKRLTYGATGQ